MPHPNRVNPATNKRYGWEEEQARLKAADPNEELKQIEQRLALLKRQQKAMQSRDELLTFTQFTMPDPEDPNDVEKSMYQPAKFHRAIAQHLEQLERGEFTQLILTLPPRAGKTELATKRFVAWFMGRNPYESVAVATYSDTMAEDYGGDVRAIMSSSQYKQVFPGFKLRRGGAAKSNIQTEKGGRAVFVGVGGALTGRGASCLIVDDAVKGADEARSQTIRDQIWEWFTKVAMTRRMGKKLVIIIMTRWHSDDIVGRLTDPENPHFSAEEAKGWKIINIPAIAEEDDVLGRKPGEPLWPERYPLEFLRQQQRLDPLGFAALYQQRPTVADGVLFKRENIQFYEPDDMPQNLRIYCASDHAVATGQRNDYTVLMKVGIDDQDNMWVLDCFRAKVPADKAVEAMLAMAGGKQKPLLWWAERGHISKSIGPFLRKRMLETGTYINLVEVTPAGDKEQRAQSIAARVAMGKVYFPKYAVWTEKVVNEMLAFPNGTHDDAVDTLAYLGLGLRNQFKAGKTVSQKSVNPPKFGTLDWVKQADRWAELQRDRASAGGF